MMSAMEAVQATPSQQVPESAVGVPVLASRRAHSNGKSTRKRPRSHYTSTDNGTNRSKQGLQPITRPMPVDPEQQELLRKLADVTGSGTAVDALQRALCRLKGESRSAPPTLSTPPTSPSQPRSPPGHDCSDLLTDLDTDEDFLSSLADIPSLDAIVDSAEATSTPTSETQVCEIDYARLMDSHGFGLVLMDISGRFLHWTKTMEHVLGYDTQQMKRLSMMHVRAVEDLPAMMALMPQLLGRPGHHPPTIASPLHLMKRCVTRSGQDLSFHVRMSVISAAEAPVVMEQGANVDRVISCMVDCHGPHTWDLPVPSTVGLCGIGMVSASTTPQAVPVAKFGERFSPSGVATKRRVDVTITHSESKKSETKKSKSRVPLPRQAVAELRDLLKASRYPELSARQAISQRYGLDRKRVDRWLENTRARQVAQAKAAAAAANKCT